MRGRRRGWALGMLALLPAACASRNPAEVPRPGFNVFSKEQDIRLGREAAAQVRQQVDIAGNQDLQGYLKRLGGKLASMPEAGDYPYEFTLINDPNINAFALPGGPVFVNSGTLKAADDEAQLAGVMAHEIAHIALRHSTNQASKANVIQLPAVLAGGVTGQGSLPAQLAQLGLGLGLNSVLLKYSRDAESQADNLGARIMAGAGYNPLEMARFFGKLRAKGGPGVPRFLSDHPNPGHREKAIEAGIRTLPRRDFSASTGGFARAQEEVANLPAPRPPRRLREGRNSFTASMAAMPARPNDPPGEFQPLRARTFSLSYPADWQAYGDADSAMVTMAPPGGLVKRADGAVTVGYGAIVNYYFPGGGRGPVRLKTNTLEMVTRLGLANRGLKVAGSSKKIRVDGRPAMATYFTGTSPYGGQETDILLTVERPEGLFYLLFVAPKADYRAVEPVFEKMVGTIQFGG